MNRFNKDKMHDFELLDAMESAHGMINNSGALSAMKAAQEIINSSGALTAMRATQEMINSSRALSLLKATQEIINSSRALSLLKTAQEMTNSSGVLSSMRATQEMINSSGALSAMKAAQEIINSSRALTAMRTTQEMINSSGALSSLKAAQEMINNSDTLSYMRKAQSDVNKINIIKDSITLKAIEQIKSSFVSIDIVNSIKNYNALEINPIAKSVNNIRTNISSNFEELKNSEIEKTFELAYINNDVITEDILIQHLEKVEENIIKVIEKNKPSKISVEGLLSIVLSIVFFIYSQILNNIPMDMIDKHFEELERKNDIIIEYQKNINEEIIKNLYSNEKNNISFVGKRSTKLKLKPTTKSQTMAILEPGYEIIIKEKKGKWVLIVYFNYLDEVIYQGWIMNKYIK